MAEFKLTEKQQAANKILAGSATHIMLFGGGRSGKTLLLCRAVAVRAIAAPGSRHAILRFRFNHVKNSVVLDTWPKMMSLCFPQVDYKIDKTDWYCQFPNGSQVWFGGLDDKERTEKILGMEFVTIFLNECSQIPRSSRDMVVTRLAQQVDRVISDVPARQLPLRMYYDENPPSKGHWTYKLFVQKRDIDTKSTLMKPEDYTYFQINPEDNKENLNSAYLEMLQGLSARLRKRFLHGEFSEETANALFSDTDIDKWRVLSDNDVPDMVRVVIAVDPSGSGDTNNAENDAIGIVAAGLGIDGNGYLLADLTCKTGPATWGKVATDAYERFQANTIVGEINFGGAMVEHVIQTSRARTPFKSVTASRGKSIRAEPVAALYEKGRIRHVGFFPELEDELAGFTTNGYVGENSPNRGDAVVWAFTELFGEIVNVRKKSRPVVMGYEPIDIGVGY
jgi:phage terminase large subunit-like protein